jgi:hypothetical protein
MHDLGRNQVQHGVGDRALIWCNNFVDITVRERWAEGNKSARGRLPRYSSTPGCSMRQENPRREMTLCIPWPETSSSQGWRRRPSQGHCEPLDTIGVVTLRDQVGHWRLCGMAALSILTNQIARGGIARKK